MKTIPEKSGKNASKMGFNTPKIALAAMLAASPASLSVTVDGIENGQPIDAQFAYCQADGSGKSKNAGNINPAISWSGAPGGTKSYAIIVVDPDVPASFELANQPDKSIPVDYPRRNFYHWVLVDIPPAITHLAEGQASKGVKANGKPTGKVAYGITGHNDYGKTHGGYDGPCPPWNDEHLHHYHFKVFALDVASLKLPAEFGGKEAENAMAGHILAQGEAVGTYTTNPSVQ